jgi:DNA-binding response OmpR family regulator
MKNVIIYANKKGNMHLTIVDDLKENLNTYETILEDEFVLELICDPTKLVDFLTYNKTDLIILDLHMPKINGFQLYEQFKDTYPYIPIIFLSGDPSEEALVRGLNLGAVDFIVKPVSPNVLIARIKNKINSSPRFSENTIKIEDLIINCDHQTAEINSKKISLTPIEFKLIILFIKNPNKIYNREYITNLIWPDVHVQNQNIDTHLSNLRKKLKPFSEKIKTIKNRGYLLRI